MARVLPQIEQVALQRGGDISGSLRRVKITTNDGQRGPLAAMRSAFFPQKLQEIIQLLESMSSRAVVEVQIYNRQPLPMEINFGKNEPFLSDRSTTKTHRFRREHRVSGQDSIALGQIHPSLTSIVNAEYRIRHPRVSAQVIELVKIASPTGTLVDFLKRNNVRVQSDQ